MDRSRCPYCQALIPAGVERCRDMFNVMLAKEYQDFRYAPRHALTVDAYALQHCEEHSPRSNAFHLFRLGLIIEQDQPAGAGTNAPRWLIEAMDGTNKTKVRSLEPPCDRGDVTIADVYGANDSDEHMMQVERWANSVWGAWSASHETVRDWMSRETLE